ncbi:MAG: hypothetical protein NUV35_00130, partial [Syntrophomonadaceae bacterium]|nr:hypothetical protein [Syntrophomonadaceae bacterium]
YARLRESVRLMRELWLGGQAVEEVAAGQEAVVVLQARVGRGDRVFKTHDAALHARAQELMVHNRLAGRIPVWVTARLAAGQPLRGQALLLALVEEHPGSEAAVLAV